MVMHMSGSPWEQVLHASQQDWDSEEENDGSIHVTGKFPEKWKHFVVPILFSTIEFSPVRCLQGQDWSVMSEQTRLA